MYFGRVILLCRSTHLAGVRHLCNAAEDNVRVRFAPSPTGHVHLGSLRTALYNHLFAKSKNGTSIIRIEDTDRTRRIEGIEDQIINDLKWCGIHYDEGPYFQSERKKIYEEHGKLLVEYGEAYYCFCSNRRLALLRKETAKSGEVPKYDNRCRYLSKEDVEARLKNNEECCIRFKLNDEVVAYNDLIFGEYHANLSEIEGDPVILKSDGFPTYHLANVVDDHLMNISHVLRGSEWLVSTIKHLQLFRAFKWKPPQYGHLPLMVNSDGRKFSKRQNDLTVRYFRENGYFPNTLVNMVTRAGGGFDISHAERDDKAFTMEELAERFDLSRLNKNPCKLPLELMNMTNRLEMKRMLSNERDKKTLLELLKKSISDHFSRVNPNQKIVVDDDHALKIFDITVDRIHKVEDLTTLDYVYLWAVPDFKFTNTGSVTTEFLKEVLIKLTNIEWIKESLGPFFRSFCKENNIVYAEFMMCLRLILTGNKNGPGVADILLLIGRENSLKRIENALTKT
ncbi:UNVERIFIED_CONTAM: hypothetical protein PYX00_002180 [Menopon gallinae]|uniref:Nondiscriminating glutamyl-tRNA synthetase EARS2, mitochondrial n=1 Tax=Menopon gallinae TaxID=328185 RepID=A0AAW2IH39_9NEOP